MYDSTFGPQLNTGTALVGVAAVQVPPFGSSGTQGAQPTSYRVRCLVTGYFQFAVADIAAGLTTAPTGMVATAPVAGTPSVNTIGMTAGQTETFTLPMNAWFISSNAAGFEVTAGEGI